MITFGQTCAAALLEAKRKDPGLSWERVAVIIQAKYELAPKPRAPRVVKKRPRDELFDALAVATGQNLEELSRSMARVVAVALADIRAVTPDLTVNEIKRRAEAYKNKHRDWPLTATSLAKYWGEFGGARTRTANKLDPYATPPANWLELAKRAFPEGDFSDRPWGEISTVVRIDILKRA